jgi:hypothetical protein
VWAYHDVLRSSRPRNGESLHQSRYDPGKYRRAKPLHRVSSLRWSIGSSRTRRTSYCENAYQIMKRICSSVDATKMDEYMLAFFQQDCIHDFDAELLKHRRLKNDNTIVTRVHAEIIVADLFSRRNWLFVDDDKYIGCSKGACFCCASYLDLHHFGFVKPASHNEVILGWRGPNAKPLGNCHTHRNVETRRLC